MTGFTSRIFEQPLVHRAEPHTQEMYAILDTVVQAVLTDENADIDALLERAKGQVQALIDAGAAAPRPAGPRTSPGPGICRTPSDAGILHGPERRPTDGTDSDDA